MSNLNCFIDEIRRTAPWCGMIMAPARGMPGHCRGICQNGDEGKSLTDIRTAIDEKYSTGYAKPTPTPIFACRKLILLWLNKKVPDVISGSLECLFCWDSCPLRTLSGIAHTLHRISRRDLPHSIKLYMDVN